MSFAQEIKDFLGAAQSTYKLLDDAAYSKMRRAHMQAQTDKINTELNDPTIKAQRQANLDSTRASTAATLRAVNDPYRDKRSQAEIDAANQRTSYYRTRQELIDDQRKMLANPSPAAGPSDDDISGAASRMPPAIGAPQRDPYDSTNYMARGGLVQKFADGGMVEDEDLDPADEDDMVTPAVTSTDVSAQSRRPQISQEAAHDAVEGGLVYGTGQLGAAGIPSPARQQRMMALRRGEGAAPLADMNAIYKKIDPNNEMSESQRNMAAMSAVYQWKLRTGDEKGAQRAAFMMLQHYRLASQRYAAIAAAAAENGDVDGAAKAAMKAYANIPDGRDLKIHKDAKGQLVYMSTDAEGKTVSQGIASPQQLAAAAMGVATNGFDQFLLDAAGQRAARAGAVGGKGAGKSGGGVPKPKDAEDIRGATGRVIDDFAAKAKEAGQDIRDGDVTAMKNVSYHISRHNDVTPEEAFDAARTFITSPEPKDGQKPFEIKRDEGTGQNRIMFADSGREITLSDTELRPLLVIRNRALKERATKEASPKGKSYGDYAADAGKAAIGMASDAYNWAKDDLEKAGRTESGARIKSAIGAIGRAAGDAYEWAKDDLSKSSVLRGMMNGPGKDKF